MSRKLSVNDAIKNIENVCKVTDLTFLGFCDKDGNKCDFYGNTSKLILQCNKCNHKWTNTNYNSFTVRHLSCPKCKVKKKPLTKDEFRDAILKKCQELNLNFLGFCDKDGIFLEKPLKATTTYLHLVCNKCGNEWKSTTYNGLVNCNQSCPKCKIINVLNKTSWSEKEIIEQIENKCKEKNYVFLGFCDKNGNKSVFEKIKYTYINLGCNICGANWKSTNVDSFLKNNVGCPSCKSIKIGKLKRLSEKIVREKIENKCKITNLSFLGFCNDEKESCEYTSINVKLHLVCNKCGNEWKSVTYHHFIERNACCPSCSMWKLEEGVKNMCDINNIAYITQERTDWLGMLSLDFYLPKHNVAIECQGEQHFKSVEHFGGENTFKVQLERDERKKMLCEEKGIRMLYVVNNISDVNWDIPIYTKDNVIELKDFEEYINKL